jgi:carbon storage regulator
MAPADGISDRQPWQSARRVKTMLVLSRKSGEAIVIDGEITVRVVEVRGERVKLAFEAPPSVPIHRGEVHERICHEQGPNAHVSMTR